MLRAENFSMFGTVRVKSWIDEEPGSADAWFELRLAGRRALDRKWIVLGLALVLAVGLGALSASSPPRFTSRTVLSVEDSNAAAAAGNPMTAYELRQYLGTAVLSRPALYAVMKEAGLYDGSLETLPERLVEQMRDAIDISVTQDTLIQDRDEASRRTHVALEFAAGSPEVAMHVVNSLAASIATSEVEARRAGLRSALRSIAKAEQEVEVELKKALDVEVRLGQELQGAAPSQRPHVLAQLRTASSTVARVTEQLRLIQAERRALSLQQTAEGERLGLRFEQKEPGRLPPPPPLSSRARFLLVTGLGFLVMLPLAVLVIGLFDFRIRDAEGLKRLGIESLGRVPASSDFCGTGRSGTPSAPGRERLGT